MARLAIDTSSALTSVAIENDAGSIMSCEISTKDSHSQNLAQLVERARVETGLLSLDDISEIVVGLGPGSFTGLRIGLSFAKGFSWVRKIPLVGIESFRAIAISEQSGAEQIGVLSDARRGEYFFAAFRRESGELTEEFPLGIYGKEIITQYFHKIGKSKKTALINAGCEKLPAFSAAEVEANQIAAGLLVLPAATSEWSLTRLSSIAPFYIRAVSALTIEDRREQGML